MPWGLKRFHESGQTHFITFSCFHRRPCFKDPASRRVVENALERVRRAYGLHVYGGVVMGGPPASAVVQMLKHIVSRKLFQGRLWRMTKALAVLFLMTVSASSATCQQPIASHDAIPVSVCELVRHSEKYTGKTVAVQARLLDHWEMGPRLFQEGCTKYVRFAYPDEPEAPPQIAKLPMSRDMLTVDFNTKRKALCSGTDSRCDFSSVDANFVGVFVSNRRLSKYWDAPVLFVTAVGAADWNRNSNKWPPP